MIITKKQQSFVLQLLISVGIIVETVGKTIIIIIAQSKAYNNLYHRTGFKYIVNVCICGANKVISFPMFANVGEIRNY